MQNTLISSLHNGLLDFQITYKKTGYPFKTVKSFTFCSVSAYSLSLSSYLYTISIGLGSFICNPTSHKARGLKKQNIFCYQKAPT